MVRRPGVAASLVSLLVVAVAGCAGSSGAAGRAPSSVSTTAASFGAGAAPGTVAARPTPGPVRSTAPAPPQVATRGGSQDRRALGTRLSIPSLGVRGLRVIAYTGHADDGPGTRIQDRGLAASPRGARGGVGPGQIGNLIITGHRTTAGGPFRRLPSLRNGAHILIASDGLLYDYVVTGTMTISFRSARSLARQSAPVPGRPGEPATRPMITLSTCATPEDHERGNHWADALGNPEHRIDKIGTLVAVRAA
jgi:sortase A